MLTLLPQKFSIQPIVEQVLSLGVFQRLELNRAGGEFFNDPWITKDEYKDTPLGQVLSKIGQVGQARLLCLESGASYTAHCDPDDRIHLSIITNQYSFLVDVEDKRLYHLPADGKLWYMDTGKVHVAANWGPRTRIHLNVRILLPKYDSNRSGLHIKVIDGDYDWKQLAYTPIMKLINSNIKNNFITGFKGINEKEVLINTTSPQIFDQAFKQIIEQGIKIESKIL